MAERSNTPENVAYSKVRVKKEDDGDSRDGHSHHFNVRFKDSDPEEYTIYCDRPRTLLEAIKSSKKYNELKCEDKNIVILLRKADKECAVPTHFPCSCIEDGELLIIYSKTKKVEEAQNEPSETVHPRNKYSVFYIESKGGKNTKTKQLFRNEAIKQFTYLCVYGEKGMTVEESLNRDGRFIDDLGDFKLSDSKNHDRFTEHTQKVDNLNEKEFKLCLPQNKKHAKGKKLQEKPCASNSSQQNSDSAPVVDAAQQRVTSVKTLLEKGDRDVNTEEIYEMLRQQFPHLREWMENRFQGDSFQEAVNLKKEDFGKIQQFFSEVHRVKKLLKLSKSVCKVVVENVCVGTGFVLFDNFILTNAHLFRGCVTEDKKQLQDGTNVFALFNYDDPEPNTDYHRFAVEKTFIDFSLSELKVGDTELDYAVLELNPEGQKTDQTKTKEIPPGLLNRFGPVPPDGEACIIGHPAGDVKKIDPTCIIEKENRGQAVDNQLEPYRNTCVIIQSTSQMIRNQSIENILIGGNQAATYNTFMYHGSSGSLVFDAHCRVFGLHTGGFVYGFPKATESVIEFAQPLLTIFERLVTKLKESGKEDLLKRVEEAKRNPDPEEEENSEPEDSD
ncbi:serine protease FAM111A-like isoform X2 [Thunnus albacares]|uniref:serine protease FAM111A-like isoform X2 n=1 Tax=Thunnus albacares TaxID=8236 RepID=UPI001CF6984E|nr:serine protease FAM111A-like isoform X2 [Thunnus albacares]